MSEGAGAALQEFAPAKVNLTLEIPGRRADGYHEIVSLIAFADVGDTLTLHPAETREVTLDVQGPFGKAIDQDNLVLRAARAFLESEPEVPGGHFVLDKRLPVAGGIGGGSADAAAAVRLLARANRCGPDWRARLLPALTRLGADIPVCIESRAAWVRGIGEKVAPLSTMPELPAVLINPGVPLPTGEVFAALGAPLLDEASNGIETPQGFGARAPLVSYLREHANDLEPPARRLVPVIGDVLEAIAGTPGCLMGRLSGSGPTCYGLFGSREEATRAARALAADRPGWWIVPTRLT
ncbi:4-(cytidine 5'-diphospho)-2-C-methyl-D-erythritol kinase [Dichotomicrobium thermohalophilum]|uniref:4-diphosphocytidyl-2-C-methyl-D-erythritol kinase n=1 Tax=Dichotomicrobium thermohalophilum TaxID=933063 RepID=A0A397Q432_9HYPH|nr:4-(cytidine 5'-diphospho)-2-C-methyl-D-erythritol kinase [Dichotomicrobium thermohalophilum]RIA55892.1 4-diphosphocytidyl-2-C-methyl-D-erythritol kinase [Dichotomicrobium thermohalophilum]